MDEIATILPQSSRAKPAKAAWNVKNTPSRFVAIVARQCSGVSFAKAAGSAMPALATQIETGPRAATADSKPALTLSASSTFI